MASTAKAFIGQVEQAAHASQRSTPTILGTGCARFWLQGLVVAAAADGASCTIDDGTGVVDVDMRTFLKSIPSGMAQPVVSGDLVMVIGPLVRRSATASPALPSDVSGDTGLMVVAHQVIVASDDPQQDAVWNLEVLEYWQSARSDY